MMIRWLTPIALALVLTSPAAPQAPATVDAATLADELAKLNTTLVEIRALLERQAEAQGLDLLMKRMELYSAQAIELEKRLRDAESERISLEENRAQLETRSRLFLVDSSSMEITPEQLAAYEEQFTSEVERVSARLSTLDDEIAQLENRLAAKRRDLDDWQGYVDRRLGGI